MKGCSLLDWGIERVSNKNACKRDLELTNVFLVVLDDVMSEDRNVFSSI